MLEDNEKNVQNEEILPAVSPEENGTNAEYSILGLNEFYKYPLQPMEWILYPFIPDSSIELLYGDRGVGKTQLLMSMAMAVAGGFDFLKFKAEKPRKVLYVDGEMDPREVKKRFEVLQKGFSMDGKIVENPENLQLFLYGLQGDKLMPDITTDAGRKALNSIIEKSGAELVIMDNISCLCSIQQENDASAWRPFNEWSLDQRRKGRAVVWAHHLGKNANNGPRGSSAIEMHINYSLFLGKSANHKASDGAAFDAEYTKTRGLAGNAVAPFSAKLESDIDLPEIMGGNSYARWFFKEGSKDEKKQKIEKAKELKRKGLTNNQIGEELNVNPKTVSNWTKGIKADKKKDTNTQKQSLATE